MSVSRGMRLLTCLRTVAPMTASEEISKKKPGYGIATGMALGLPLGVAAGLIFFDSVAIGAGVGISVGLAIGAGLEYSWKNGEPEAEAEDE